MALAGNYTILSAAGVGGYLQGPNFFPVGSLTVQSFGSRPIWELLPVGEPGSNLYTFRTGINDVYIGGDSLFGSSFLQEGGPANFSIEPAGDNQYRFHVPNEDRVWTVAAATAPPGLALPVFLDSEQGISQQDWILTQQLD